MKYISCFSGVGGLEGAAPPMAYCEIDEECRSVLSSRFPEALGHDDVSTFTPPKADVVTGGWPCQDISVAGNQVGLAGGRSKLFYELVRVAVSAQAETLVAENVPNLLTLNRGREFSSVLNELQEVGYKNIAWRLLNARDFGLPHERRRVLIVASKNEETALSIHREIPEYKVKKKAKTISAGFYWTAGLQSICYSVGFCPTLKVGSSLGIASPPAVHYNGVVRKLTSDEALKLQGFDPADFDGVKLSSIYRMAGNAVAVPVGRFVLDGVSNPKQLGDLETIGQRDLFGFSSSDEISYPKSGIWKDGQVLEVISTEPNKSSNLSDFIDLKSNERLSTRAAKGFLSRLDRSGKECPESLLADLEAIIQET